MAALAFLCSLFVFGFSARAVVGPYAADADTLLLFQFDDAAGQNVAASAGSLVSGGNKKAYAVNETTATTTPAAINSILGGSAYPGFGSAANFNYPGAVNGAMIGWDFNDSGAYDGDISSGTQSADRFNMSTLNIGNGGQTSWTMETLIKPTSTSVNQEIICTDSSASSRAFQFRINNAAQLEINFIGVSGLKFLPQIPTTGTHAYAANTWFHVAAAYDGTTLRFYWTKVDPSVASANLIGSTNLAIGTAAGALQGPLVIGNENRAQGQERFQGSIDEVRISSVARAATAMIFSTGITLNSHPQDQTVTPGNDAVFSVDATATTDFPTLSYQWYQGTPGSGTALTEGGSTVNGTGFTNVTSATLTVGNAQAADSGLSLYCVISNDNAPADTVTTTAATMTVYASKALTWHASPASYNWASGLAELNWDFSGNTVAFTNSDTVTFDNTGGQVSPINIADTVLPGSINVTAGGYTFSGSGKISGGTALTKSGAGTLTLTGTGGDDFSGGIIVASGGGTVVLAQENSAISGGTSIGTGATVQVGNNDANGALPSGSVVNDGALNFNRTDTALIVANAISGSGSVSYLGSGTVTLTGANIYSGSTVVDSGTLALAGGASANSAVVLSDTAGATLSVLSSSTIGSLSGGGASGGNLALTGTLTAGADNTSTTFAGNSSGAGGLTKTGNGTLTLAGTNNYTGITTVSAGTLAVAGSGSISNVAAARIGSSAGNTAILNVGGDITVNTMAIGGGGNTTDMGGGTGAGAGAVYQTNGTVTLLLNAGGPPSDSIFTLGGSGSQGTAGYGYYNISGGTLVGTTINVGGRVNQGLGVMDVLPGGTVQPNGSLPIGRGENTAQPGYGLLNVAGGAVNFAGTVNPNPGDVQLMLGYRGGLSALNISSGGSVTLTPSGGAIVTNPGLDLMRLAGGSICVVNLNASGTLTTPLIKARSSGGGSVSLLNFDGGTLKATSTNTGASFLSDTNITAVTIYGGGATVDNNGTTITIGNALIAASGNGVQTIVVTDGGSNYIGAPLVQVTGGTAIDGAVATAVANMIDDGSGKTLKVGSISITSPGSYSADPTGVSITGNGSAIPAAAGIGAVAANTSGGLASIGNGTLYLNGINTYTGSTVVSNGVLGGNGAIAGDITIVPGATLAAGASVGTFTIGGTPTLNGTILAELNRTNAQTADKIVFNGGVSFSGALTVTNIGPVLVNGDTFDLFDGSLSDSFTTLNLPGGTGHWDTTDLNVGGTLTFTNASPVASNITMGVALGETATLLVIGGKNTPTDADGDSMTIISAGPATTGTSGFDATHITYTADGSLGTNTFSYTVSDALGATDTKTITVIVYSPEGFNQISATTGGGNAYLTYLGIPGTDYALEITHSLTPPITWSPLVTNTAATNGYLNFTNVVSLPPTNDFYRTHAVTVEE